MANALEQLSERYGVLPEYFDVSGVRHMASDETRRTLLGAMGVDASSPEAIAESLRRFDEQARAQLVPPVIVWRLSSGAVKVPLSFADQPVPAQAHWRICLESGELLDGVSPIAAAPMTHLELRELPLGYHQLSLFDQAISLIIVPDKGFTPDGELSERRLWGVAVQLYGVVSDRNWGIGDCGDLLAMGPALAEAGAAFVGLNPLHALFPHDPSNPSPYSPSSRLARNIFYIDPSQVPEFSRLPEQQRTATDLMGKAGAQVAYAAVYRLKLSIFESLYRLFKVEQVRVSEFESWKRTAGEALSGFALHEALTEQLMEGHPERWGWPVWPQEFQDPQSEAVARFAAEHADRVDFYLFLQWTLDLQLAAVSAAFRAQGVTLGLYHDLALGSNGGGAELWVQQDLYAAKASMGAPPDPLGPQGQNWGLPPMIPHRLRERLYEPFIAVLRAAMRHGGALRLDHVMSLMRLFWIPAGRPASEGAYVSYPFADLLGIVALESQRARVVVIGEDLGTVPPEVQEGMSRAEVLSYKVFYFMTRDGQRIPLHEYPKHALVVTSTHDLPTLEGYFHHRDIEVREQLGILADPAQVRAQHEERRRDLHCIEELVGEAAWQVGGGLSDAFVAQVHGALAGSSSLLQAVQLEDVAGELDQANLPGTVDEHPNWRRKLSRPLAQLLLSPRWCEIVAAMRLSGRSLS